MKKLVAATLLLTQIVSASVTEPKKEATRYLQPYSHIFYYKLDEQPFIQNGIIVRDGRLIYKSIFWAEPEELLSTKKTVFVVRCIKDTDGNPVEGGAIWKMFDDPADAIKLLRLLRQKEWQMMGANEKIVR